MIEDFNFDLPEIYLKKKLEHKLEKLSDSELDKVIVKSWDKFSSIEREIFNCISHNS